MATVISEFSGQPIDTYSMEWRFECECAHVLAMPDRLARNNFIDGYTDHQGNAVKGVRKVRGDEAAEQLRKGVMLLWEIRQQRNQHGTGNT